VADTPIKLREPGSVLGFAEHMIRDYSKNALVGVLDRQPTTGSTRSRRM
jgi:hypothetical protein